MPREKDLFIPVVSDKKLHPSFKILLESDGYIPARSVIREIFDTFVDVDGNFVEQFQTTGFDSRIWELYLYTYLSNDDFAIDNSYSSPDFIVTKSNVTVCLEAVTVNPTQSTSNQPTPHNAKDLKELLSDVSMAEIFYEQRVTVPIKLGSALYSKLQKKYWELQHVQGRPLILVVEDFHKPGSLFLADAALQKYLYGLEHEAKRDEQGNLVIVPHKIEKHMHDSKVIPSGFFSQPGAEYISAVLFSNSGTLSKFNRMGQQEKYYHDKIMMIRAGYCYNVDPNAAMPLTFVYEVGDPQFRETWKQGLSMNHNPNALYPIPKDIFPGIAHHFIEDGAICSEMPPFHPYTSATYTFILRD